MPIHFVDVTGSTDVKVIVDKGDDLLAIRIPYEEAKVAWSQLGHLLDERALGK